MSPIPIVGSDPDESERDFPQVFSAAPVTRAGAREMESDVEHSESAFSLGVLRRSLFLSINKATCARISRPREMSSLGLYLDMGGSFGRNDA